MVLVVVCQAALAVGGTYSGKRWPSVARPRYVFVETPDVALVMNIGD